MRPNIDSSFNMSDIMPEATPKRLISGQNENKYLPTRTATYANEYQVIQHVPTSESNQDHFQGLDTPPKYIEKSTIKGPG